MSRRHARLRALSTVAAAALTAGLVAAAPTAAHAASPLDDAFYRYTGTAAELKKAAPGTVLRTRTVPYSIAGSSLQLKAVQVLYRTQDQIGQPSANVTTLVRAAGTVATNPKVLSYQAAYDSSNPADEPSVSIVSGKSVAGPVTNVESAVFAPLLAAGYVINVPDTEGQKAAFADGRAAGIRTIDSLRAIRSAASGTGVTTKSSIGLLGYSGGGTASEWAAEVVPTRDIPLSKRIVGTAVGGISVHLGHTMHYVEGSQKWAGYLPLALASLTRSFGTSITRYLSTSGAATMTALGSSSAASVYGNSSYAGLTWSRLSTTKTPVPEKVHAYVLAVNHAIMGRSDHPSKPLFIGQGTNGVADGTPVSAAYGAGDGLTIAGDTRALAKSYCAKKIAVTYVEYPATHYGAVATWLPAATAWLQARFAGTAAPSTCSSIAAGNSLAPMKLLP